MSNLKKRPVIIDLETKDKKSRKFDTRRKNVKPQRLSPAEVAPVQDLDTDGQIMQIVTYIAVRKPSKLLRYFFWVVISLAGFAISITLWDFTYSLFTRNLWLGRIGLLLVGGVILACLLLVLREVGAIARLRQIDGLRATSENLLHGGDLKASREFGKKLLALFKNRPDLNWAIAEFQDRSDDIVDVELYLNFVETTLLSPLDKMASKHIEIAARQVATATAIIPLALLDIIVALTSNIRMIRRISEVYGGRVGAFGSWRLIKAVALHLVATGAVAIGDDMLGSLAGGGILSKVSRRFGEGVINGALSARVGIAAMEVCRPMPFMVSKKPKVTGIMKQALMGFWGTK